MFSVFVGTGRHGPAAVKQRDTVSSWCNGLNDEDGTTTAEQLWINL